MLLELRNTKFYEHPVLKQLIDGQEWDGEIFGYPTKGKWIIVNDKRIVVYPPEYIKKRLPEAERRRNNLLFAGLHKIKDILESPSIGNCEKCKFSIDHFAYENQGYEVCSHPLRPS